jgi:hypothetical protein
VGTLNRVQSLQSGIAILIQGIVRLLGAWQRLATHESWKSLVAEPELTSSWWATDNFLFTSLELINVPRSEDDLVFKKFCLGRDNPDKEIGGKRDCERIIVSYLDIKTD